MLKREELLDIFDRTYEARCSGDVDAVRGVLAPNATFCLNGEQNALEGFPQGHNVAHHAIGGLMERFRFHSYVRLNSIVDGNRVAVHARAVVSTGAGDPVTTELMDLWTFDDDGKVASIVQFADTELISKMVA